jgi:hypothetical protein
LTSSLAPDAARDQVKCRQRHRRARNRASKSEFRAPTECSQREGHTVEDENASLRQARRSPRAVRTSRNCTRENRETSPASEALQGGRSGPGSQKRNPDVHAGEESSRCIVPAKRPNKAEDISGGGRGGKAAGQGDLQRRADAGHSARAHRCTIAARGTVRPCRVAAS